VRSCAETLTGDRGKLSRSRRPTRPDFRQVYNPLRYVSDSSRIGPEVHRRFVKAIIKIDDCLDHGSRENERRAFFLKLLGVNKLEWTSRCEGAVQVYCKFCHFSSGIADSASFL